MQYVWIAPPLGFAYGFPKLMPVETTDVDQWLYDNGYPSFDRDTSTSDVWLASEDEVIHHTITTLDRTL